MMICIFIVKQLLTPYPAVTWKTENVLNELVNSRFPGWIL